MSKRRRDEDYEYVAVPIIQSDYIEHTDDNPFCYDPTCPCKEDQEQIQRTNEAYQGGLLTGSEATRRVMGRSI
ncbi:hypothetical protein [Dictyobacter kobayashii]|uniref:Uncharacterized protein n=1 Tax=Dictyobacter kobayashii TaxID=2014872 RepID=A0A402AIR3_9CHLR|nr:hypothetical protein [Dictyobacter kobayashii]GCE18953.1 hypothetical protein KDK_27530 [Dictyobacter kobayashii]